MLATTIAALRSALAYLVISLYVLVAGTIGLLIAVPFRWKGCLYALGHAGVFLALRVVGIRYKVVGLDQVPPGRAVIFCSNHQSNVDPPILYRALHRRLHILFKAELRKLPVLGVAMEVGGFIPIERADREGAMASIERAARSIEAGNSFLIFPEGTRSRNDELLPFKKGGFIMAIKSQAPIVPVAITGARASMRRGSAIVRPVTVTIRVGKPIETQGLTVADRGELIAHVRGEIEALLREGPLP